MPASKQIVLKCWRGCPKKMLDKMLWKVEDTCLDFAAVNMYKFVLSEMPDKLSCRMPDKMLNKKIKRQRQ